ncbi:YgaP family membrane protein [Flavobacterium phycosphaerae]|uniref:YgaP family membrane protein n=1 Tax=Flavobacterium phycosphaerae TaxID=2697515 RepID=UPI001389F8DD|nr:DUF2892 domain-containing protein [Flavobacterium phycosphaerae]
MRKNMGSSDRVIRVLVAAVIAFLYYNNTINGIVGIILLVFACVFVLTSFMSFCPLYVPFRINTCNVKKGIK